MYYPHAMGITKYAHAMVITKLGRTEALSQNHEQTCNTPYDCDDNIAKH